MTSVAIIVLLIYYGIALSASHDTGIVVVTTSQLREEIRSQMNDAELCSCNSANANTSLVVAVTDSVKAAVSRTVKDILSSELSHLITPGYTPSHPVTSCEELLKISPRSPSGLYWIRGTDNGANYMYCDMERSCEGVAGGWMRVASIDMTDTSSTCPSGLRTLTTPRRLCGKSAFGPACSSAVLPVQGVQYSRVCGKIIGYQQGSVDAFHRYMDGQTTIDSIYVDGISVTHSKQPRQHIWTFSAALHEHNSPTEDVCSCTNTRSSSAYAAPGFVGHDYFCDTGSEVYYENIFYGADPLWDGAGCGRFSSCCSWNSPPWFMKNLSSPTSDDIEVRLCADEPRDGEDINFETLELYVQ